MCRASLAAPDCKLVCLIWGNTRRSTRHTDPPGHRLATLHAPAMATYFRRKLAGIMRKDETPATLTLTRPEGPISLSKRELSRCVWADGRRAPARREPPLAGAPALGRDRSVA